MTDRTRRSLASAPLAVALTAALVAAGAARAAEDSFSPPRTSDGQPNLQGYWTNSTVVPFERPAQAGDTVTEEEARARIAARVETGEAETQAGTAADVHYQLEDFGLDQSQNTMVLNTRTSLVVDPPTGRFPAALPDAVARGEARAAYQREHSYDSAQDRPLAERCILWGHQLPITPVGYNSNLQIHQAPGYVTIVTEMIPDARIVPLDGRAHIPAGVRQWLGDSVGRWQGNVLIVETTNLNGETSTRGTPRGGTMSMATRITEEFELVGPDTIRYRYTVEDPQTWERPFSVEYPMSRIEGPLFEYACHEGNYGIANILSGQRAEERKAAEAATAPAAGPAR